MSIDEVYLAFDKRDEFTTADLLGLRADVYNDGKSFIRLIGTMAWIEQMNDEEFIALTLDRTGAGRMSILENVAKRGVLHMKSWEFPTYVFEARLPGIVWRHIMPYRQRTIHQRASKRVFPVYEFPDDYYLPPTLTDQQRANRLDEFERQHAHYLAQVMNGMHPQDARLTLPQLSLYDTRFWKLDAKNWQNFLSQRLDKAAQYHIGEVARTMHEVFWQRIFTHTGSITPPNN